MSTGSLRWGIFLFGVRSKQERHRCREVKGFGDLRSGGCTKTGDLVVSPENPLVSFVLGTPLPNP